jgi:predicted NBD/HSP70 family sugar kinase
VRVKTPTSGNAWVRQLVVAASEISQKDFWGVLVSVPGIVDESKARVLFSPNLHWTESLELPGLIQQIWAAPVLLVQEERALALGHQSIEARGEDFLLVDFGEGVGGTAIVAGRLYTSPLPLSGELGHTQVLGNQRKCGCGAMGCIETLVGQRGLLQSYAAANPQLRPTWEALSNAIQKQGIPEWLEDTLDATGIILAGALNVLGVRRLIVTGILTDLPVVVMEYLSRSVVRGTMWARFGAVKVESAPRRRIAGLVAIGIDRLVLPMEKHSVAKNSASPINSSFRPLSGWLSYSE